jgi:hypothetical protein
MKVSQINLKLCVLRLTPNGLQDSYREVRTLNVSQEVDRLELFEIREQLARVRERVSRDRRVMENELHFNWETIHQIIR